MSISLCMIVKNEEKNLSELLPSIKDFVDEIIIVDTGSTDKTKEEAKRYTNKIFDFVWTDDFSTARNFSLTKATKEWILILDADERISEKDLKKLKELTPNKEVIAYKFEQRNYSNKPTPIKWRESKEDKYKESKQFKGWQYRGIIRLFRNDKRIKFEYLIHETVLPSVEQTGKKIENSNIPIHHYYTIKGKEESYYKLLKEKIKTQPTAHTYAELAIHCYETGKRTEADTYKKEAIRLNKAMNFLDKY
jgi:glycosyltransferase involved in cell wall biosynthesis